MTILSLLVPYILVVNIVSSGTKYNTQPPIPTVHPVIRPTPGAPGTRPPTSGPPETRPPTPGPPGTRPPTPGPPRPSPLPTKRPTPFPDPPSFEGIYKWQSRDGEFKLYICQDQTIDTIRFHSGFSRPTKNAFDLPDGSNEFFPIIGRTDFVSFLTTEITAFFSGFRQSDSFGFQYLRYRLVYNRITLKYSLQFEDESYALTKITRIVNNKYYCWVPTLSSFNDLKSRAEFVAENEYDFALQYKERNKWERTSLDTNDWSGCFALENLYEHGDYFNYGDYQGLNAQYGLLTWENRLMITTWNDYTPDARCFKGIEFLLKNDAGYFSSWRCVNEPTVGWAHNIIQVPITLHKNKSFCPIKNTKYDNDK